MSSGGGHDYKPSISPPTRGKQDLEVIEGRGNSSNIIIQARSRFAIILSRFYLSLDFLLFSNFNI